MQVTSNFSESLVCVETTARLHMGFIDMHGGLGRQFGSIGLSLDQPCTTISFRKQSHFSGEGAGADRALQCARNFAKHAAVEGGMHIEVSQQIPEHAGLGSGTQMALAVGVGINALYGLGLSVREVALYTGRGVRSGIGVGAFESGGLLVDGGRGAHTQVPPILARLHFPEDWRVLLVIDNAFQGVHGDEEVSAFGALPPFPAEQAAHIARLVLMQALPAVAEHELTPFGQAISEIQTLVGQHFAPAQGGSHYSSPQVASVMGWLKAEGVCCTGQSSWGPTGFAVVSDSVVAERLMQAAQQQFPQIKFVCCSARNKGSIVRQGSQSKVLAVESN